MWSRSEVDVIGNLSGLKAVMFLWRFGMMREQFVGRDRRESPAFLLFMRGNDNQRHRKNSKATNPSKTDTNLPSDCTEKTRTTVCRGKRTLFLHLQLILAFISSKYVFPYKVYKSYTELGLPVSNCASLGILRMRLSYP